MSSETEITIKCPRCKHVWKEDVNKLEQIRESMYKSPDSQPKVVSYRATCPVDGTIVIVDVAEESGDD